MHASWKLDRGPGRELTAAISGGLLALALALAAPAFAAMDDSGGGGTGGGAGQENAQSKEKDQGAGSAKSDAKTCQPGQVWDRAKQKCLERHSGVIPDSELTEYARALAEADRFQEALDVLDLLDNPNTPRALNYRGYATRKLGRTDEGIHYYLKSVALDPSYPQVREYLGEAYVIEGKFDLAKDQLATIEKICGS